jgi:hypothetical protein
MFIRITPIYIRLAAIRHKKNKAAAQKYIRLAKCGLSAIFPNRL